MERLQICSLMKDQQQWYGGNVSWKTLSWGILKLEERIMKRASYKKIDMVQLSTSDDKKKKKIKENIKNVEEDTRERSNISNSRVLYSACKERPEVACKFEMPLHYPRFNREDYETMPEWQLDRLLQEYGLPTVGTLHHKQHFAMGTFLWRQ